MQYHQCLFHRIAGWTYASMPIFMVLVRRFQTIVMVVEIVISSTATTMCGLPLGATVIKGLGRVGLLVHATVLVETQEEELRREIV